MKKNIRRPVCLGLALCQAALCLSACGPKAPGPTEPATLRQDGTNPVTPTIGMEIPLAPADRNPEHVSGNSFGIMAETENGYYAALGNMSGQLCYADKSDLTNWVLVCNKPDCKHEIGYGTCSADIQLASGFRLRDGRIYTLQRPETHNAKAEFAICSMALDGTDYREERLIEEIPQGGSGRWSLRWCGDGVYYNYSTMDKDGSYESGIKRITDNGVDILYTMESMDEENIQFFSSLSGTGDYAAKSAILSGDISYNEHLYRFTKDGYEEIPGIAHYNLVGALLKEDSLYHFNSGDGYYCTDLTTGESIRWMNPQFPDSRAEIFGTDIVLETNMHRNVSPEVPEMRIFNGSKWESVSLPNDIWLSEDCAFPHPSILTSQHLFFYVTDYADANQEIRLYSIDLTADTYEAVLCCSFA